MNTADQILEHTAKLFPRFGVNKKNQVARLIYEISRRESADFKSVAERAAEFGGFQDIKKYLLSRRFPEAGYAAVKERCYLPKISLDPANAAKLDEPDFKPREIVYEKAAETSQVLRRAADTFPSASLEMINSLKSYMASRSYSAGCYSERRERLFIIKEEHDFFKKCPCTSGCVNCGYTILNSGFGCPYECTYCYLQDYTNIPGITLPANPEDFLRHIPSKSLRVGTGEFCDSLVLDNISGQAGVIARYVREKLPEVLFEFKTKSANIDGLLSAAPADNVVAAWSVNPQEIISKNEHYTESLERRLEAARECAGAGFSIAFHFDPIIRHKNWEDNYRGIIDTIFNAVSAEKVRWISLGTLRFSRKLKRVIEERFPENDILDGELLAGFDGKIRYQERVRIDTYKKMSSWIKERAPGVFIYLCMESQIVWEESGLVPGMRWRR